MVKLYNNKKKTNENDKKTFDPKAKKIFIKGFYGNYTMQIK
jgi:hypothetical protein